MEGPEKNPEVNPFQRLGIAVRVEIGCLADRATVTPLRAGRLCLGSVLINGSSRGRPVKQDFGARFRSRLLSRKDPGYSSAEIGR